MILLTLNAHCEAANRVPKVHTVWTMECQTQQLKNDTDHFSLWSPHCLMDYMKALNVECNCC